MLQAGTVMGRRPGSGAAFASEEEYRAEIRSKVYARAATQGWRLDSAESWQIADWLEIRERTLYKYNRKWRISLDDIRHRRV